MLERKIPPWALALPPGFTAVVYSPHLPGRGHFESITRLCICIHIRAYVHLRSPALGNSVPGNTPSIGRLRPCERSWSRT
eukprot:3755852-Karenia_brevis.AAC.1